jgi:hypothetical protein
MEVELILNALEQAQRRLQETTEKEELRVHLSGIQRSYKRTERLLELVVKFTTEELIQLFEKALK